MDVRRVVQAHLSGPMPEAVFWHLVDDMARLGPLEPTHRRVCDWCGRRFYVEAPSHPNRFCSCRCSRRRAVFTQRAA